VKVSRLLVGLIIWMVHLRTALQLFLVSFIAQESKKNVNLITSQSIYASRVC